MTSACVRQIDAQNEQLMGQHLACAALELPLLLDADRAFFGPRLPAVAAELRSSGARALSRSSGLTSGLGGLLHAISDQVTCCEAAVMCIVMACVPCSAVPPQPCNN